MNIISSGIETHSEALEIPLVTIIAIVVVVEASTSALVIADSRGAKPAIYILDPRSIPSRVEVEKDSGFYRQKLAPVIGWQWTW